MHGFKSIMCRRNEAKTQKDVEELWAGGGGREGEGGHGGHPVVHGGRDEEQE